MEVGVTAFGPGVSWQGPGSGRANVAIAAIVPTETTRATTEDSNRRATATVAVFQGTSVRAHRLGTCGRTS